jgi:hypothetical protein
VSRNRKPHQSRLDPDDVLAGRGRAPSAPELCALIREVNPTGLALPAAETARRYAVKSRLQSQLVRRFGDEVVVTPEPREPGVVSLRHGSLGDDACHALLQALDEDARSWVQRRLDVPAEDAPEPAVREPRARGDAAVETLPESPPGDDAPAETLVAAGLRAIEAYDYELARACLNRALARSAGGAAAALPLLELLVEHLGADAEALAVAARLPADTRELADVRGLIALAAARAEDQEQARRLLRELRGTRAATVLLALARAGAEGGDVEGAGRDLAEARQRDPAHAGIAAVAEAIAARRARARGPREEALGRLLDAGQIDEAEGEARAILARFPESGAAQRALRVVEEQRRTTQIAALLDAAEAAFARGEALAAAASLRQALAAGLRGDGAARAQERIAAVEADERARVEGAEEDGVARLLAEADPTGGIVAYLALEPRRRGRVRGRAGLPVLGWVDDLDLPACAPTRARGVAAAMLALGRADVIAAVDPAGALAMLEPHGKVLQGHHRREAIAAEARRHLEAGRREVAARRLRDARAAEAGGALEEAKGILAEITAADLAPEDRAAAAALRAQVDDALELRRLAAAFARLLRDGAPLEAREAAEKLLARTEGDERARWEAARVEAQAAVQRAFHVEVDLTPEPVTSLRDIDLWKVPTHPDPRSGDLIVAEAYGPRIFVRVIDPAARVNRRRAVLRTPRPLALLTTLADEDRLFIMGVNGLVLELSTESFAVLGWHELGRFEREPAARLPRLRADVDPEKLAFLDEIAEEAVLVPGTRILWVKGYARGRVAFVRVIDLDRRRILREMPAGPGVHLCAVPELRPPGVALTSVRDGVVTLHDAHGAPLEHGRIPRPGLGYSVVAHPGRDGVLMLTGTRQPGEGNAPSRVQWCAVSRRGEITDGPELEDLASLDRVAVTADASAGMVYIHFGRPHLGTALLALRARSEGAPAFDRVFCVPTPERCLVLKPSGPCAARLLALHDDGFELQPLGAEPPRFPFVDAVGHLTVQYLRMMGMRCYRPAGARWTGVMALVAALKKEPRAAWGRRILAAQKRNDPDRLMELAHALEYLGETEQAAFLGVHVSRLHPHHAEARIALARALLNIEKWDEVCDLLLPVDPRRLDPGTTQHFHHALGHALLGRGQPDAAREALEKGAAIEGGRCDLSFLFALVTPLPSSPGAPEGRTWNAEQSSVRELLTAIQSADEHLAQGDAAGARRAVDRLIVNEAREVQSLGRLAEAWLLDAPPRGALRFDKARALASFCAAQAERSLAFRRELLLPRGRWDEARLSEVASRAAGWLEETYS